MQVLREESKSSLPQDTASATSDASAPRPTSVGFAAFCDAMGPVFEAAGAGASIYLDMRNHQKSWRGEGFPPDGGEAISGRSTGRRHSSAAMRMHAASSLDAKGSGLQVPSQTAAERLRPEEEAELTFRPAINPRPGHYHVREGSVHDRLFHDSERQLKRREELRQRAIREEITVPKFRAAPVPKMAHQ